MEKVQIKKVIGPTDHGVAVLLGNEKKTFVIFIGLNEGAAIIRELRGERAQRPLTHDLLDYVFAGFSIEIRRIIISSIVDNTFYATLILEQKVVGDGGEWTGKRNEVRIDARPSDCLVLALKEKKEIFIEDEVFQAVTNIDGELEKFQKGFQKPSMGEGIEEELDLPTESEDEPSDEDEDEEEE
jgi:bifunctional DNase/RNase